MMKIEVKRKTFTDKSTIGEMFIDGKKYCYTLEDTFRFNGKKVFGVTCIPSGEYEITLRKEGKIYESYKKDSRVNSFFDGSLWIRNIPNFEYVLIHIGNYPKDTLGCILVGMSEGIDEINDSTKAFKLIYPIIYNALVKNEKVIIKVA